MSFDQDGIGARLDSKIQKLIILFVFDRMAISLSESALLDICTSENDWLSYMDCKQYLGELIDTNLLYRVPKSDYINITQDGIGCLALFFSRIPTSIRDDINTYARENRMRYKKRQSYFCDYSKNADGTYSPPSDALIWMRFTPPKYFRRGPRARKSHCREAELTEVSEHLRQWL